jgi:hypothetical protein
MFPGTTPTGVPPIPHLRPDALQKITLCRCQPHVLAEDDLCILLQNIIEPAGTDELIHFG